MTVTVTCIVYGAECVRNVGHALDREVIAIKYLVLGFLRSRYT